MVDVLENKRAAIAQACARFGVARLDVFGSALRDDFRPGDSDLDLLVEFSAMHPHDPVDAYFGLLDELRAVLAVEDRSRHGRCRQEPLHRSRHRAHEADSLCCVTRRRIFRNQLTHKYPSVNDVLVWASSTAMCRCFAANVRS